MSKSHWLTKKRRKRIIDLLYQADALMNHAKNCELSKVLIAKDPEWFEKIFERHEVACTCGCNEASMGIARAIIAMEQGKYER